MPAAFGNLSSSPKQGSRGHEQQITHSVPEESILITGTVENPQGGGPAKTPAQEPPQWYSSPEWALVLVGGITCGVIGWQAWETRRSVKIAKDSVVLTHRPKIIIRSVVIPWLEILNRHTSMATIANPKLNSEQLDGFFYVVNTGNQPATIISLDEYMAFIDKLPMERPYESGKYKRTVNITLQAGASCKIPFTPTPTNHMELAQVSVYESAFFVIGRATYADSVGTVRETAFCRRIDRNIDRLVVVNDPDYEYTD